MNAKIYFILFRIIVYDLLRTFSNHSSYVWSVEFNFIYILEIFYLSFALITKIF